MTIDIFDLEATTNMLGQFFPTGMAYGSNYCEGSVQRIILESYANEFKRANDLISIFLEQQDVTITENFLGNWENALGIPDDCIPIASTNEERRENIILKLTALSVVTEQDYMDLATQFGFTIIFVDLNTPGVLFPYPFPHFFLNPTDPFSIIIDGDFSTDPDKAEIFQCLIKKIVDGSFMVSFIES